MRSNTLTRVSNNPGAVHEVLQREGLAGSLEQMAGKEIDEIGQPATPRIGLWGRGRLLLRADGDRSQDFPRPSKSPSAPGAGLLEKMGQMQRKRDRRRTARPFLSSHEPITNSDPENKVRVCLYSKPAISQMTTFSHPAGPHVTRKSPPQFSTDSGSLFRTIRSIERLRPS